jgi:acyl dehydratase
MLSITLKHPEEIKHLVGREVAVTEWHTISQECIQGFANVTGDTQWIHVDKDRSQRESPFKTTVAHGFLTLSLLSGFLYNAICISNGVRVIVNYGLNRVRFPSPVFAGSRIRAHFIVESVRDDSKELEVVFLVTMRSDTSDKPCCVAEWIVRYYR